jgi:hypothetical protein
MRKPSRWAKKLKKYMSLTLVAILAISLMAPTAWSRVEIRKELCTDGVVYGTDISIAAPQQTLFHQQTAQALDCEAASVNFPEAVALSPGTDLALPFIAQQVDQTSEVQETGLFTANYCYCPGPNNGNVPLTANYISDLNSIQPGRLIGSAPMYPEMVNLVPGQRKLSQLARQANNTSSDNTNKSLADQIKSEISLNLPINITSDPGNVISFEERECPTCVGPSITPPTVGVSPSVSSPTPTPESGEKNISENVAPPTSQQGYDLSYEHFNMSADTNAINNMSITDRMWRNSRLGGTMWTAYEGDTASPSWIAPFDKPQTVIQMTDHFQVIKDSLNLTEPGTTIKPRFWRL